MRYAAIILLAGATLWSCSRSHTIEVANQSGIDREGELASVALADVRAAMGPDSFVLRDAAGAEVPYQITYDSLVVFPATVAAGATVTYTLEAGTPAPVDTLATGAFYARRKDDLAWENDRSAYRAYGPALQASGEKAYGYDIWTKSVPYPVVDKRYHMAWEENKSFHDDHGEGMDQYAVGPTLGAGTTALLDSADNILYPWCYRDYEILDNGPLRFTLRLVYPDTMGVRETRLITLDAGEYLNRTVVTYEGLADTTAIVAGLVVHEQNPDGYAIEADSGYLAYADLTQNADADNGVIYVGVVAPQADSMMMLPLAEPVGDAIGHLVARGKYAPGTEYVYYWGSGWSKGFMPDWESWRGYLSTFSRRKAQPLVTTVK